MSKSKTAAIFYIIIVLTLSFCVNLTACYDIDGEDLSYEGGAEEQKPAGDADSEANGNGEAMTVKITVNGTGAQFIAEFYDNGAAEKLYSGLPFTLEMNDMPHEKYCYLDYSLPEDEVEPRNIYAGDIMLWRDNCLVVFYEPFETSYSYTRPE